MPRDELSAENRTKLDGIVQQMTDNNESDDTIMLVVNDFKSKYSVKKKDITPSQSTLPQTEVTANVPSALENGTSELANTGLESPATNDFQNVDFIGQNNPQQPAATSITANPDQQIPSLQSAATSSGAVTTGAIPVQDNNSTGGILDRLHAGAAHLYANISEAPAMLWNTAAAITDPIGHAFGLEGTGAVKQENPVSKHFKDIETAINEINPKEYDKASLDYMKNGEITKGLGALGDEIAESLPASIGLMLGGVAGAGIKGTTAVGSLVFGADKKAQLDADPLTAKMPESKKIAISLGSGAMETLFEGNMGISQLGTLTKKILEKSGKEAAEKFAKEGFEKAYKPALQKWVGVGAENAVQEAGTQFSQNVIDKYWGVNPDLDLTHGLAQAALQGVGAHAMTTTIPTAMEVARTKTAVQKAKKIQENRDALEADLASKDVSPEVKPAILEKIHALNAEEAVIAKDEKEKFEALPEDKKKEVDQLLKEAHKISGSVTDATVSEKTKEVMNETLDKVEGQIEKIYEDSAKNKEEESKDKATHDEWLKSFEEEVAPKSEVAASPAVAETSAIEKVTEEKTPVTETPKKTVNETTEQGTAAVGENQQGAEEVSNQNAEATTAPAKEKQKQELIDEEEQIESRHEDDKASVQKLNDDVAILKGFTDKDVASKKFKAILDRAFKMKEEKKISKPTYTKYRNQASQVLGPKINLDAEEAKYKIESLKEEVKKKLLGEGYKKVIMSAPGFGPKQVADLIDLTAKAVNVAIDAGYTVKDAVNKALEKIKTHPHYKKLIEEGHVDEETFKKSVASNFEKAEVPEKKEDAKVEAEGKKIQKSTREHSIAKRITENEDKFKDVSERLKKKGIEYESIDQKKATTVANDIIDEHAKDNLLHDLADRIIEGKSDIPYQMQGLIAAKLVDKMNVMAENETNSFLKETIFDKAAELAMWWAKEATKAGQFNGMANQEISNNLPMSKEGLRTFAKKEIEKLHDTILTEEEKNTIDSVSKEIIDSISDEDISAKDQKILEKMVSEKIREMSEEINGKEYVEKLRTGIASLKMDLSEC